MHSILARNVQNRVGFWGSAPDPVGKLTTLPDPLVVRGFLPSAIAASRLWRLQFSDSHVYTRKTQTFSSPQSPPPRNLQSLDFFTSNMSHYLKSLKICPEVFPLMA